MCARARICQERARETLCVVRAGDRRLGDRVRSLRTVGGRPYCHCASRVFRDSGRRVGTAAGGEPTATFVISAARDDRATVIRVMAAGRRNHARIAAAGERATNAAL